MSGECSRETGRGVSQLLKSNEVAVEIPSSNLSVLSLLKGGEQMSRNWRGLEVSNPVSLFDVWSGVGVGIEEKTVASREGCSYLERRNAGSLRAGRAC
jgi:hypothetical protein